jgi:type I restriction enzyme M protein
MSQPKGFQDKVSLIWSVADILRGDFKPHEYGQTILPFVVLRRLECALEKTKDKVIAKSKSLEGKINDLETILNKESGHNFYNTSPLSLTKILQDPNKVATNLNSYIRAFSPSASEVLDKYGFPEKIKKLEDQGLLYQIIGKFADIDLSEETVSNETMGYVFEELLRKFSEMSNETAGEHYTPRDVIKLMVNLLFENDSKALASERAVRSIYDPACGTGGMLSMAQEHLSLLNPEMTLNTFGQELNAETWAVARSDLMIKGQDPKRIAYGNSLTSEDGYQGKRFDYIISNPPYGVDWNKYSVEIKNEFASSGPLGRYSAGLPRVSDGSFLFIQQMLDKMKPVDDSNSGTRIAVILSASPLTSGGAGSSESNIRRWILESDYLESVIALPDQMFYNTKIFTYIWILTNNKPEGRKGKVLLIDGRKVSSKMKKGLGEKQKYLSDETIASIVGSYAGYDIKNDLVTRITMKNSEFSYIEGTLESPLKGNWKISQALIDENESLKAMSPLVNQKFGSEAELTDALADYISDKKTVRQIVKSSFCFSADADTIIGKDGKTIPHVSARMSEYLGNVGIEIKTQEINKNIIDGHVDSYFEANIKPYQPEAWFDKERTKIGYEIPFTKLFYEFSLPPTSRTILEKLKKEMETEHSWIEALSE